MASYCPCGKQSPEFQTGCHPAGMQGVPILEAAGSAALKPPTLKMLIFFIFFVCVCDFKSNECGLQREARAGKQQTGQVQLLCLKTQLFFHCTLIHLTSALHGQALCCV